MVRGLPGITLALLLSSVLSACEGGFAVPKPPAKPLNVSGGLSLEVSAAPLCSDQVVKGVRYTNYVFVKPVAKTTRMTQVLVQVIGRSAAGTYRVATTIPSRDVTPTHMAFFVIQTIDGTAVLPDQWRSITGRVTVDAAGTTGSFDAVLMPARLSGNQVESRPGGEVHMSGELRCAQMVTA